MYVRIFIESSNRVSEVVPSQDVSTGYGRERKCVKSFGNMSVHVQEGSAVPSMK
jgi:hypothetical protein